MIGRKIKVDDFNDALSAFICDGERLLVYHIPRILRKLWQLASIIHKLDGFRFYGCSLLFLYDGESGIQEQLRQATEESLPSFDKPKPRSRAPSSAIQDPPAAAETSTSRHKHQHHHQDVPEPARGRRQSDVPPPERRARSADAVKPREFSANLQSDRHIAATKGEVKIRIVDFAHTTTGKDYIPLDAVDEDPSTLGKKYHTVFDADSGKLLARFPPQHPDRPDMGFIFGIRNLCDAFVGIWDKERHRRRKEALKLGKGAVESAAVAAAASGEGVAAAAPAEGGPMEVVEETEDLWQLPKLSLAEGEAVWERVLPEDWNLDGGYLST